MLLLEVVAPAVVDDHFFEDSVALGEQRCEVSAKATMEKVAEEAGRGNETELVADAGAAVQRGEVTLVLEEDEVAFGHELADVGVGAAGLEEDRSIEASAEEAGGPGDLLADAEEACGGTGGDVVAGFLGGALLEIDAEGQEEAALDWSIDQGR